MEPTTYLVNVADGLPLKTTAPDEGMLLFMIDGKDVVERGGGVADSEVFLKSVLSRHSEWKSRLCEEQNKVLI